MAELDILVEMVRQDTLGILEEKVVLVLLDIQEPLAEKEQLVDLVALVHQVLLV